MQPERRWSGPMCVQREAAEQLVALARERRPWIEQHLLNHGAILFRGFEIDSAPRIRELALALCDRLSDYVYRSTPRTSVESQIFTATEYRADAAIPMHNENSYQRAWPTKLVFCCEQPALAGGETPLASSAAVTRRIDAEVVRTFKAKGVMYVRHYRDGLDLDWRTTFQTESRADVESYCRREGLDWEWLPGEGLRTRQVCHAVARHPRTGEELWFNQAHLFHPSSLDPDDREALIELCGEDQLPRHACFGDGSPIDEAMLRNVRDAYASESRQFAWERGDALLLDNMLVAHGRQPYRGPRKVLVAMGDPIAALNFAGPVQR